MKKVIFTVLLLILPNFVLANFNDVDKNSEFYDAISYVQKEKIVGGYADETYKPNKTINRAEFTKIIVKATINPEEIVGSNCFKDVRGDWFSPFVCTAKNKGIISGYPDGTFKPNQNIKFIEAAKIISNAFAYKSHEDAIWYKPFIDNLANRAAIPLSINNIRKEVTRGEMAEMIFRLKTEIYDKSSMTYDKLINEQNSSDNSKEILSRIKEYLEIIGLNCNNIEIKSIDECLYQVKIKTEDTIKNFYVPTDGSLFFQLDHELDYEEIDTNKNSSVRVKEARKRFEDFIDKNNLGIVIKEVTEENCYFKVTIDTNGFEVDSYISKNGKLIFQTGVDITEEGLNDLRQELESLKKEVEKSKEKAYEELLKNIPKQDKPKVELFVMSYCPFGTQIEKGILPVLDVLGDDIDFELKFVNYVMHDKKEIKEQMLQYCIQRDTPGKFLNYLKCFLEDGNSNKCVGEADVDEEKTDKCVEEIDQEYKIMDSYFDVNTWNGGRFPIFPIYDTENEKYGIKGSPTLVINGKIVRSGRDPDSLLKAICAGFKTQTKECEAELSSDSPSAGFGYNTGKANNASCG